MSRFQPETFTFAPPFGGHDVAPLGYRDDRMSTPALAPDRASARIVLALAAFFVLAMSASGARVAIPGLREHTRMVMTQRVKRPSRGRKPVARAFFSGRKVAKILRAVVAWSYESPRTWLMPARVLKAQRTPGQDGSMGVPRGHRWLVLGGSGRLGPGATS